MNILSVHNRYIYRGGEDESSELENALLRSHGHAVFEYIEDNLAIAGEFLLGVGLRAVWSPKAYSDIRDLIRKNRIDLVRVDNFFPRVSPAVFYAAGAEGVPTVQTLRNFRILCPSATFFRNGLVCEDCLAKTFPFPGILHGCYRKSRSETIGPAAMASVHRLVGTWTTRVTAYVALSIFCREKFIEGGLPAERIFVKPNFVEDTGAGQGRSHFALFVGRLSDEKGIDVLLSAWKNIGARLPLKIVGSGPLEGKVRCAASSDCAIEFLGAKSLKETYDLMGDATVLVFPSQWYETFGRTIAEAFAKGTPVVATNLGSMQAMVSHGKTGLHFEPGSADSLVGQIDWMLNNRDKWEAMRAEARQEYERHYTPGTNYETLMQIYDWAMHHKHRLRNGATRESQ